MSKIEKVWEYQVREDPGEGIVIKGSPMGVYEGAKGITKKEGGRGGVYWERVGGRGVWGT